MAEATSVASRMQKLAKLKRLKKGLSSTSAAASHEDAAAEHPTPDVRADADAAVAAMPEAETAASAPDDGTTGGERSSGNGESEAARPDTSQRAFDDFTAAYDASEDEPEDDAAASADSDGDASASTAEGESPTQDASPADRKIDAETARALEELAALAGLSDDGPEDKDEPLPDFATREIDPEMLEREFGADAPVDLGRDRGPSKDAEFEAEIAAQEAAMRDEAEAGAGVSKDAADDSAPEGPSIASEDAKGNVSIRFDASRSTLLNHVSRQMSCSVEDVVVTALDWYLDALFGEDDEADAVQNG